MLLILSAEMLKSAVPLSELFNSISLYITIVPKRDACDSTNVPKETKILNAILPCEQQWQLSD